MKDYRTRVRRLEVRTGAAQEKSYIFVRYGHRTLESCLNKGRICFKKGNYKGIVEMIEMGGGASSGGVDSESPQGIEILRNHGYEMIKPGRILPCAAS